jgi:hypothetical protein
MHGTLSFACPLPQNTFSAVPLSSASCSARTALFRLGHEIILTLLSHEQIAAAPLSQNKPSIEGAVFYPCRKHKFKSNVPSPLQALKREATGVGKSSTGSSPGGTDTCIANAWD